VRSKRTIAPLETWPRQGRDRWNPLQRGVSEHRANRYSGEESQVEFAGLGIPVERQESIHVRHARNFWEIEAAAALQIVRAAMSIELWAVGNQSEQGERRMEGHASVLQQHRRGCQIGPPSSRFPCLLCRGLDFFFHTILL